MIDIQKEQLILFSELPNNLPKRTSRGRQKPIHLSACYRWKNQGICGVRLETVFVAGNRYTSREAVNRFWAAVTEAKDKKSMQANKQARRAKQDADQELEEAGW